MLELLAPAGSMDALRAAVQNGADAVYLGCGSYNARMGAKNFTPDELREAVTYCHVRDVAVHLTLNTLVSDREFPEVVDLIRTAAVCGVDAFIVQDWGVVSLCREIAPKIPIHASTQMSIHSLDGVLEAARRGISRVVLARELPKEEIAAICRKSPIEIEVFVHGALCMCYSGQCYFSGIVGQRSGNRGQCAQPCRMAYGYGRFENRYPLSLKDNCLIQRLAELNRMGVASIKIEGRAKRPEYVATVVRIYRSVLNGNPLTENDARDLENIFSRQGFTEDYYRGRPGPDMFGTRQDTREDRLLLASARSSYESGEHPRVPLEMFALVKRGEPVSLAVRDRKGRTCKASGEVPEQAIYKPLTAEILEERLRKTGGTPYYIDTCRMVIDEGLTVSAAAINALRRDVLSQLTALRSRQSEPELYPYRETELFSGPDIAPVWTASVMNYRQITLKLLDMKPAVLYVPLSELSAHPEILHQVDPATELCAVLPRVIFERELSGVENQLRQVRTMGVRTALTGNLGQIGLLNRMGFRARGDFGLNLYNSRAMNAMKAAGLLSAACSFELTFPKIRDISKPLPVELIAYGRLPLMLTENCVIHNRTRECTCEGNATKLVDRTGQEFPLTRDPGTCRNVILNGKKLYLLDLQKDIRKLGVWAYRLSFTTESEQEVDKVLACIKPGTPMDPANCTRGLYFRGVKVVKGAENSKTEK